MTREPRLPDYCATCERETPPEEVMGQQYQWPHPESYDGISEWLHMPCGRREGRWSGRKLEGSDYEYRYGGL